MQISTWDPCFKLLSLSGDYGAKKGEKFRSYFLFSESKFLVSQISDFFFFFKSWYIASLLLGVDETFGRMITSQ